MKTLLLLALLISGNSFAKSNIEKVEVFPPFMTAGCENGFFDNVGTLGLRLTKGSAYIVDDSISVVFTHQLVMCSDLGTQDKTQMRWVNVDPFKGFEVPFYNHYTNQRESFHQVIINADKSNKFELRYHSEENSKLLASASAVSKKNGTFEGTLTISNNDLLDQNDFDLLDKGKEVSKSVEYNQRSIMSRIYPDPRLNDVTEARWSSRFIKFTFTKSDGQIKLSSFSIN
jgi:hypothetical protein